MVRFPVSFLHEIAWEDREGTEQLRRMYIYRKKE